MVLKSSPRCVKQAREGAKRKGKDVFIGVPGKNQRTSMQGVRNEIDQGAGRFELFERNVRLQGSRRPDGSRPRVEGVS